MTKPTSAQNLVLCLLANTYWARFPREPFSVRHKVRTLCRKIGLNHRTRTAVFRHAVDEAKAWFASRGIELCDYGGGCHGRITLGFFAIKPKIERKRLSEEELAALQVAASAKVETIDDAEFDHDDSDISDYVYDADGDRIAG